MLTLSVPDMTCAHCKASIEAALSPLNGVESVTVDLARRTVAIAGGAEPAALILALSQIGFPSVPLAG